MKPIKAYYSLIQYCPDRSRNEAANIGLVLFSPETNLLLSKLSASNDRISRFFGRNNYNPNRINFLKSSIERRLNIEKERLTSLEDFKKFINTRANDLLITNPRSVKVSDPEKQLDELFMDLVGGRSKSKKARKLFPCLDKIFKNKLKDRMSFDLSINVPFANRTLHIPYAYRNGVRNFIKPYAFGPNGMDTGLKLAAEGELIQKNPDNGEDRNLIILPKLQNVQNSKVFRSSLSQLFYKFDIRTIWDDQIDSFADEVVQQARM